MLVKINILCSLHNCLMHEFYPIFTQVDSESNNNGS